MVSFSSGSSLARVLFRERNPSGNTTTMACLSLLRHGKAGRNMRYFKRMFLTRCLHFYATRLDTPPGADYLRELVPNGVEYGYTVFSPFRRQGYAREACEALMRWAYQEHQVKRFVVSIRPDNLPSRRLAEQLGFQRIGSQVDEVDGPLQ